MVHAYSWPYPVAGPQEVSLPGLLLIPSLLASSRVKLVPLVLVVPKALKVLAVNLALLGPPGRLVPL